MTRRGLLGLSALGVVLFAGAMYFTRPDLLLRGAMMVRRRNAGLQARISITPIGRVPYLTGGRGERTIVLLHGFQQDKDIWIDVARELQRDYRLVIPDQFGFGDNVAPVVGDYRPEAQARRLHELLTTMHLQRVDLVGWSMGGEIAAMFARLYPDMVNSLALVNAAGGRPDTLTPLDRRLLAGEKLFHVTNGASFDTLAAAINDSGLAVPALLRRAIVYHASRRAAQWDTVFQQLVTEPVLYQLDSIAPLITARTLVLWGAKDPLYPTSIARRLASRIPQSELEILADCGHLCPVSKTGEVVARYRAFLSHHAPAFALGTLQDAGGSKSSGPGGRKVASIAM